MIVSVLYVTSYNQTCSKPPATALYIHTTDHTMILLYTLGIGGILVPIDSTQNVINNRLPCARPLRSNLQPKGMPNHSIIDDRTDTRGPLCQHQE